MSSEPASEPRALAIIENRRDGGVWFWLARLYGFGALIAVVFLGFVQVLIYDEAARTTPPPPDLARYASAAPTVSRLVAADGTPLGGFAGEWREVVPFESIPTHLVNAVLAAEDHRFFEHHGLDLRGIARAAWRNVIAGDFAQGGSTITQQVAKQFLSSEKSLSRKLKEAIMARRLEAKYSKRAILSVYLNHIFLGAGAFGVKAAARRYFDKRLEELAIGEMALLAGLAQAPSRYSPLKSLEAATARRNQVLERMARHGYLEQEEATREAGAPLTINPVRESFGRVMPYAAEHVRRYVTKKYGTEALMGGGLRIEATAEPVAEAFAYDTVDFGARKQDKRQGWRGPVANLDEPARQTFRKRAGDLYSDRQLDPARRYLALVESVESSKVTVRVGKGSYVLPLKNGRWAYRWSKRDAVNDRTVGSLKRVLHIGDVVWVRLEEPIDTEFFDWTAMGKSTPRWKPVPSERRLSKMREEAVGRVVLEQVPHPQAAILTSDHHTGYVVAMVGGTDAARSGFNRALQACRQPGSTYKPIYYSAALDEGFGFDTSLNDIPKKEAEVDPVTGEVWIPENLGGTSNIRVSLEYAMVYSKNVPSVAIFRRVGADKVALWARRLGFTTKIIADKALALGASCTMLDELTRAFAIFAQSGRWVDFHHVRRIRDREGQLIEDNTVAFDPMLTASDRLDRVVAHADQPVKQVIAERTAFLTSKLLRQAIRKGFASILRKTDVIAAGKTGTSSATMDTSFVAYTARWITTVWMGDDLRERPLGVDDAAYITVVPMWSRYMRAATAGHAQTEIPWELPAGVAENDRGDHSKGSTHRMPLIYDNGSGGEEASE